MLTWPGLNCNPWFGLNMICYVDFFPPLNPQPSTNCFDQNIDTKLCNWTSAASVRKEWKSNGLKRLSMEAPSYTSTELLDTYPNWWRWPILFMPFVFPARISRLPFLVQRFRLCCLCRSVWMPHFWDTLTWQSSLPLWSPPAFPKELTRAKQWICATSPVQICVGGGAH